MPAIVKILMVFAGILLLARVRLPLGLALILGGIGLDMWAGHDGAHVAASLGRVLAGAEFWVFVVVMALIVETGRYLTDRRNADEIVGAVQRWGGRHGRAGTVMAVPAVIGLIPMPAGALVSAPFVHEAGGKGQDLADWKSGVNYWFRHVWEYWWPLYPGVIIAMSIFDLEAWKFILAEILFTPVAIAAGYWFLVRPHVARLAETRQEARGSDARALMVLLPVAVVIAAFFVAPPLVNALFPSAESSTRKLTVLLLGMAAAVVVMAVDEIRARRAGQIVRVGIFSTLFRPSALSVLGSLAGVLIFKGMLGASGLLPEASQELLRSGIPVSVAVAALPFLAGLVTGIALGFTGSSFPMVVGLMAAPGSGLTPLATLVLAYPFGYVGMMLSPVHLCLLTTRDYFASSAAQVIRMILPCVTAILLWSVLSHLVLRALGW